MAGARRPSAAATASDLVSLYAVRPASATAAIGSGWGADGGQNAWAARIAKRGFAMRIDVRSVRLRVHSGAAGQDGEKEPNDLADHVSDPV